MVCSGAASDFRHGDRRIGMVCKIRPDPSTDTELRVLTARMGDPTSLDAEPDRANIRAGKLVPVAGRWLWTGTLRTFSIYRSTQPTTSHETDDAAISLGFRNLKDWERRRGQLLRTSEQPAQIGSMLFVEVAPRYFTWLGWTQLKHDYDSMRLLLAAVVGCLALLGYGAIRLVILLFVITYKFIATGAVPSWASFLYEESGRL